MTQVAIVGAGLAGLRAACTLLDHQVDVIIVEASQRVGGRARTIREDGFELPIELGPEFVHGEPEHTLELARDPAIALEDAEQHQHVHRDGRLIDRDDLWSRFGELTSHVDPQNDQSARAYLEHLSVSRDEVRLLEHFVEGFYGADLDDISIASVAADAGGAAGGDPSQAFVRGGYRSVVESIAARIPRSRIHLGAVVDRIEWDGPVRLAIRHGRGHDWLTADRAIVTVPLGVLQAGAITFAPELDVPFAALAMGQVVKLVFRLRAPIGFPPGGDRARIDFVHGAEAGFPTYWLRSHRGAALLTAWAGGRSARALAGESARRLVERALEGFATAIGVGRDRVADLVVEHYHHDFAYDPFIRGAYSYPRVGHTDAVDWLARPLLDRLWLAGEATDREYEGTVAGALASGERAATQILAL